MLDFHNSQNRTLQKLRKKVSRAPAKEKLFKGLITNFVFVKVSS